MVVAITPTEIFDSEATAIKRLLDGGVSRVHIRHPHSSCECIDELLSSIDECYYERLSLHDCHTLALKYQGVGIHLNSRNSQPPTGFSGIVSKSCHQPEDIENMSDMDYCFLSPIFDSFSKPGYKSHFTLDDNLKNIVSQAKVIALGGVTPDKFDTLSNYGFAGGAMLGWIWQQYHKRYQ